MNVVVGKCLGGMSDPRLLDEETAEAILILQRSPTITYVIIECAWVGGPKNTSRASCSESKTSNICLRVINLPSLCSYNHYHHINTTTTTTHSYHIYSSTTTQAPPQVQMEYLHQWLEGKTPPAQVAAGDHHHMCK